MFLAGSAASGNTKLAADLVELAALRAAHGDPALTAALERAAAFRRWRASDVRSILAAGAGTPQPRAAGDALVIELPKVPDPAVVGLQDRRCLMTAATVTRPGRRPG